MSWTTPLKPLAPGDGWCLAEFPGGMYEFIVHPDEAEYCLANGIKVDGISYPAEKVDQFPELNGVLMRVWARK